MDFVALLIAIGFLICYLLLLFCLFVCCCFLEKLDGFCCPTCVCLFVCFRAVVMVYCMTNDYNYDGLAGTSLYHTVRLCTSCSGGCGQCKVTVGLCSSCVVGVASVRHHGAMHF